MFQRVSSLLLLCIFLISSSCRLDCVAFSVSLRTPSPRRFCLSILRSASDTSEISLEQIALNQLLMKKAFDSDSNPSIYNFTLEKHTPLGCTIEESLAPEVTDGNDSELEDLEEGITSFQSVAHVFISKIQPGGHAEAEGLKVGDVIVGVSDLFGDGLVDVTAAGLDKIRGLIASCPEDRPLQVQVVRGASVLEEHERALVQLCTRGSSSDEQVDACILDFLKSGYELDDNLDTSTGVLFKQDEICQEDPETECILDNMQTMWAEDLGLDIRTAESSLGIVAEPQGTTAESSASAPKATVKPWSLRSSPSGTFVRDPVTRKLKKLEEQ